MAPDLKVVSISGTQFEHNDTVNLSLLCGLSGTAVIPLKCDGTGLLLTSGVN